MIVKPAHKLDFIKEYYFSRKLREVRNMIANGIPVLNLGIGNPDMAPSQETIEALRVSAENHLNHGYQSYTGIEALRKKMAEWYQRTYNVLLKPENEILPLIGSKEGISHISHAFLNPGDKVLVPNPGYPTYISATRLAGGVPILYDLKENENWSPALNDVAAEILEEAKILWINYPNMPTGTKGNILQLEKVLEIALKYKLLVVNDNPYSLVLNEDNPFSIFQLEGAKEVALELNSLSKSHNMAGWRIGMLTGAADYIQTVLKVKSNVDSGMFKPLQEAAIAALDNDDEWHSKRNEVYKSRRKIAWKILDKLECSYSRDQVGMFVWAKIPHLVTDVEVLTERLLHEANIFLTPGFIFGDNGKRFIRISLCSKNEVLEEALKRVNNFKL